MSYNNQLNYQNLSNSQVLLHPNPKGVVQFIGSFIFGSFPAWAYKDLNRFLFDQGYSLILYKFPLNPFQFNHWQVALDLLKEQYILKSEIIKTLQKEHQSTDILNWYANPTNYLWLGHSLGSKYIILLEILSNTQERQLENLQKFLDEEDLKAVIKGIKLVEKSKNDSETTIGKLLPNIETTINHFFIQDQPSVLLAPEISNTVRFLRSDWRISNPRTKPNQKQTEQLIQASQELFNLLGIISFSFDSIAEDDIAFLAKEIKYKKFQPPLFQELPGFHFEPLALHIETLGGYIIDFFDKLKRS